MGKAHRPLMALGLALYLALGAGGAAGQTLWDDPAFALYRQALEAFEQTEYDRAGRLAREAITHYPEHLLAYYLIGQAAMAQENWDEAIQAFSKVVSFYPKSFAGHRELGIALAQVHRVEEAMRAFQTALRLRTDDREVQARLAFLYLRAGKQDPALSLLKTLADKGTKVPEVWAALGRLYYDAEDFAASEKALRQAAALRDDSKTWFNLGLARLRLDDPQGAVKAFERAARDPELREQANRQVRRIYHDLKTLDPAGRGLKPPRRR